MFLGEFFKNYFFYTNSLNQIKPDIIMSGLALRPRHARIQMRERGGPELVRTPKNHKATFFMYDQYPHSSETSFKWRFFGWPMMARL